MKAREAGENMLLCPFSWNYQSTFAAVGDLAKHCMREFKKGLDNKHYQNLEEERMGCPGWNSKKATKEKQEKKNKSYSGQYRKEHGKLPELEELEIA